MTQQPPGGDFDKGMVERSVVVRGSRPDPSATLSSTANSLSPATYPGFRCRPDWSWYPRLRPCSASWVSRHTCWPSSWVVVGGLLLWEGARLIVVHSTWPLLRTPAAEQLGREYPVFKPALGFCHIPLVPRTFANERRRKTISIWRRWRVALRVCSRSPPPCGRPAGRRRRGSSACHRRRRNPGGAAGGPRPVPQRADPPFQVLVRAEPIDLGASAPGAAQGSNSRTAPGRRAGLPGLRAGAGAPAHPARAPLLRRPARPATRDVPAGRSRDGSVAVGRPRRAEPDEDREGFSTSSRDACRRARPGRRQLGRSGPRTRRLTSRQIAELLHRCWSPELARVQRLREELGAYLAWSSVTSRCTRSTALPAENSRRSHEAPIDGRRSGALVRAGAAAWRTSLLPRLRDPRRYSSRWPLRACAGGHSLPATGCPGWLSLLVETDLPIEASLHVHRSPRRIWCARSAGRSLGCSRRDWLRCVASALPIPSGRSRSKTPSDSANACSGATSGSSRSACIRCSERNPCASSTNHRRVEEQLDALLAHSRRALWDGDIVSFLAFTGLVVGIVTILSIVAIKYMPRRKRGE